MSQNEATPGPLVQAIEVLPPLKYSDPISKVDALEIIRRHEQDYQARLRAMEQERDEARRRYAELQRVLFEGSWPTPDVLRKLADAADHLLRDHNCDNHGCEEIAVCRDRAREVSAALLTPTPATDQRTETSLQAAVFEDISERAAVARTLSLQGLSFRAVEVFNTAWASWERTSKFLEGYAGTEALRRSLESLRGTLLQDDQIPANKVMESGNGSQRNPEKIP